MRIRTNNATSKTGHDYALLCSFRYFRQAWSPRAAYHLARFRYGQDGIDRLVSAVWLLNERVPLTGEVPTMNFAGLD